MSKSLFGNLGGGHLTVREYQLVYSKKEFDSYFKFTFVRNPWERALSAFMYFKIGVGMCTLHGRQRECIQKLMDDYADFDSFVRGWVNSKNIQTWFCFYPQYAFICDVNMRPLVDFIGRHETIREDYAVIRQRLGSGSDLQWDNRTRPPGEDYREFYTEETRAIIADVYRDDIRILGYSFDGRSL